VLATAVADARPVPHTLLCASAVGIYGDRGDDPLDESSPPGTGYLADVARAWESEAGPARAAGARVAHLRFGIVLAREGGALPPMALACRLGLGGSIGTGRHWMSWITLEDTLNAIGFALAHGGMRGPVNVVSPQPVRQADLSRALSRVLRRPDLLRVPAWLIGAVLGEMGRELLLASQRVEPARLVASGFTFRHPSIDAALRSVLQETARD
jgi:uncharacterized protein (TIGR01777 family)